MLGYIISDKENINVIEHEIQSFDVLRKTNLTIFIINHGEVLYKNNIINNASKYGHVQVLEWFKRSGYKFKYDKNVITLASRNGRVQVLEWFKHSGYEFKYNKQAINWASGNGHVQVLEWFKHSGYEFKYDEDAICWAACDGHVQVLEWFKHSGYEFQFGPRMSGIGYVRVLGWIVKLKYRFKYLNDAIIKARNIFILEFFIENNCAEKVIEWSKRKGFRILRFKEKKRYFKGYEKN